MADFYPFFIKYDEDKDDDVRSLFFYFIATKKIAIPKTYLNLIYSIFEFSGLYQLLQENMSGNHLLEV